VRQSAGPFNGALADTGAGHSRLGGTRHKPCSSMTGAGTVVDASEKDGHQECVPDRESTSTHGEPLDAGIHQTIQRNLKVAVWKA
jgi:hypothetical protein